MELIKEEVKETEYILKFTQKEINIIAITFGISSPRMAAKSAEEIKVKLPDNEECVKLLSQLKKLIK